MEDSTQKKDQAQKFWPYRPRTSFVVAIIIFLLSITGIIVLKTTIDWPKESSENVLLIAAILLSVFPVVLAVIDIVVERGGKVEYQGVKIDFSVDADEENTFGFQVPDNIANPGEPFSEKNIDEILEALEKSTTSDSIVIDLKHGNAWWDTRLLVLLAGAVRHGKPEKIVFTGAAKNGIEQAFISWGYPSDLLPNLLRQDTKYPLLYHRSLAAARQWDLAEPGDYEIQPSDLSYMESTATDHKKLATDSKTKMPNKLFAEQLFAYLLSEEIEQKGGAKPIKPGSLGVIFDPIFLKDKVIDTTWDSPRQLEALFDNDADYIAINKKGRYKGLVSRVSLLSEVVKELTKERG